MKARYKISPEKSLEFKNDGMGKINVKTPSLPRPLPVVGPNFKEDSTKDEPDPNFIYSRSRACFSSLTSTHKSEEEKKMKARETYRYNEED